MTPTTAFNSVRNSSHDTAMQGSSSQVKVEQCAARINIKHISHASAAQQSNLEPINLVLIHGWGFNASIWHPLTQQFKHMLDQPVNIMLVDLPGYGASDFASGDYAIDLLCAALAYRLPSQCVLIGWSLGGNIALQLAQRYRNQVRALITIAANPRFIQSLDWPGVDAASFSDFERGLERGGARFLKRFAGLCAQNGERLEKTRVRNTIKFTAQSSTQTALEQSLTLTATLDSRAVIAKLECPQLHVLAAGDALCDSVALAERLKHSNAAAQVQLLADAAHACVLTHSEELAQSMTQFISAQRAQAQGGEHTNEQLGVGHAASTKVLGGDQPIDKARVAAAFNKAAGSYDRVADFQFQTCTDTINLLPKKVSQYYPKDFQIVDLGCGTGYGITALNQQFEHASILALDLAHGMLLSSRERAEAKKHSRTHFVEADFEQLPFAPGSVDLVFSNLALQWSTHLGRFLEQINSVLKHQGYLVFSTLLDGTLEELRQAWREVDRQLGHPERVHVNQFLSLGELNQVISHSPLNLRAIEKKRKVRGYASCLDLMRELKQLGATNANHGRNTGITPRRALQLLEAEYPKAAASESLQASYEVAYVVLQKST